MDLIILLVFLIAACVSIILWQYARKSTIYVDIQARLAIEGTVRTSARTERLVGSLGAWLGYGLKGIWNALEWVLTKCPRGLLWSLAGVGALGSIFLFLRGKADGALIVALVSFLLFVLALVAVRPESGGGGPIAAGTIAVTVLPVVLPAVLSRLHAFLYPERTFDPITYSAETALPARVYEGDSHNIVIELRPASATVSLFQSKTQAADGKAVELLFSVDSSRYQYLEIQFLAAGIIIDGEKQQRKRLALDRLSYRWNAYFPNSGNHTIAFVFRLVGLSEAREIGSIQHTVRVVKLGRLTKRQIWVLASIAAFVSGAMALVRTLHEIGVW